MLKSVNNVHALLLGLSEELAGELLAPLKSFVRNVRAQKREEANSVLTALEMPADIIFCGPDVHLVSELRSAKPETPIVVVSRHAEVSDWLDSIEAGATDYCAAPFESFQLKWVLETSMRSMAAMPMRASS